MENINGYEINIDNPQFLRRCPFCLNLGAKIKSDKVCQSSPQKMFCFVQCQTCFAQGPQGRCWYNEKYDSYEDERLAKHTAMNNAAIFWNETNLL